MILTGVLVRLIGKVVSVLTPPTGLFASDGGPRDGGTVSDGCGLVKLGGVCIGPHPVLSTEGGGREIVEFNDE